MKRYRWIVGVLIWVIAIPLASYLAALMFEKQSTIHYLLELKQKKINRLPGVYRENLSDSASFGQLSDSTDFIVFDYKKSTQINPSFVAVYFPIEDLGMDLSVYNEIEIELNAEKAKRLPVLLSLHYETQLVRYLSHYIDVQKGRKTYRIKVRDFHTPAEWFENNNKSMNDLPPSTFKNIKTLSIEGCHLLAAGIPDRIRIYQINFLKDLSLHHLGLSIIALCSALAYTAYLFWKKYKKKIIYLPINTVDLPKESNSFAQISLYIAGNYTNADLSLDDVQRALGLRKNDISKLIKEKTDLSFPQYLNRVRITEAKRLLMEMQPLSIKEIAYETGFNSPNNFNRVFKNLEGLSPMEFLEKNIKS